MVMKEFVVRAHFTIKAASADAARQQVVDFLEDRVTNACMEETMPDLTCSCVDNLDEVVEQETRE